LIELGWLFDDKAATSNSSRFIEVITMSLTFTVGGARDSLEPRFAAEVAELLDNAFGAESQWERSTALHYGEQADWGWSELQRRATDELGTTAVPNLLAIGAEQGGVFLPAYVQTVSLPLSAGSPLKCASLHGLRNELADLAHCWELPLEDHGLEQLLDVALDPDDGWVAEAPEILTFARLALASNEAARRDCPLWLVGNSD
jgi:hypothetical protein